MKHVAACVLHLLLFDECLSSVIAAKMNYCSYIVTTKVNLMTHLSKTYHIYSNDNPRDLIVKSSKSGLHSAWLCMLIQFWNITAHIFQKWYIITYRFSEWYKHIWKVICIKRCVVIDGVPYGLFSHHCIDFWCGRQFRAYLIIHQNM